MRFTNGILRLNLIDNDKTIKNDKYKHNISDKQYQCIEQ